MTTKLLTNLGYLSPRMCFVAYFLQLNPSSGVCWLFTRISLSSSGRSTVNGRPC